MGRNLRARLFPFVVMSVVMSVVLVPEPGATLELPAVGLDTPKLETFQATLPVGDGVVIDLRLRHDESGKLVCGGDCTVDGASVDVRGRIKKRKGVDTYDLSLRNREEKVRVKIRGALGDGAAPTARIAYRGPGGKTVEPRQPVTLSASAVVAELSIEPEFRQGGKITGTGTIITGYDSVPRAATLRGRCRGESIRFSLRSGARKLTFLGERAGDFFVGTLSFRLRPARGGEPDYAVPVGLSDVFCSLVGRTQYVLVIARPPGGDGLAFPLGINRRGMVVGYSGPEPFHPLSRPMRVLLVGSSPVAETLEVRERQFGFAHGVNDEGTILVGENDRRPVAWIGRSTVTMAVPEGYFSGVARAINVADLVVGSFADYDDAFPVGPRPCAWPSPTGTPVVLQTLSDDLPVGMAVAVNDAGQIAGSLLSDAGFVAVRWDDPDAAPVVVGGLEGAVLSESRAMNAHGDIAGRSSLEDDTVQAFLARAGGAPEGLPFLPGGDGYAEAFHLDDEARVVGTARAADGNPHAVLWHDGEVIDLNDCLPDVPASVLYLSSAVGIDSAGRIAVEVVLEGRPEQLPRTVGLLLPADGCRAPIE